MGEYWMQVNEAELNGLVDHLEGRIAALNGFIKNYLSIGELQHPDCRSQMKERGIYENIAKRLYSAFPGLKPNQALNNP